MRLLEIERKARSLGIKDTWKYSKDDLIRAIQQSEGNNPCFTSLGRKKNTCDQQACCWRPDCVR